MEYKNQAWKGFMVKMGRSTFVISWNIEAPLNSLHIGREADVSMGFRQVGGPYRYDKNWPSNHHQATVYFKIIAKHVFKMYVGVLRTTP